jgi:hypothetical protein
MVLHIARAADHRRSILDLSNYRPAQTELADDAGMGAVTIYIRFVSLFIANRAKNFLRVVFNCG